MAELPRAASAAPGLLLGLLVLGCYRDEIPPEEQKVQEWDSEELRKQRERLPEVAKNCYDDIVGIWVGQSLLSSSWHHFTLDIVRDELDLSLIHI